MTETVSADGYGICLNDLSNHRPETDDRYQINYQGSSYLTTNSLVAQAFSYLSTNDIRGGINNLIIHYISTHMLENFLWTADFFDRCYLYAPSTMPFVTNNKPHSKEEIAQAIYKTLRSLSYEILKEHDVDVSKAEFYEQFNSSVDPDQLATIIDEVHDSIKC